MTSATPDIVVPDTSCLIALEALDQLELLHDFYPAVIVPPAVALEYGRALPDWLRTQAPADQRLLAVLGGSLGPGESEAIVLAGELPKALLVLDDLRARRMAARMGLRLTGTLGVLLRAKRVGRLPSLGEALRVVGSAGFRVSAELRGEALRLASEAGPEGRS